MYSRVPLIKADGKGIKVLRFLFIALSLTENSLGFHGIYGTNESGWFTCSYVTSVNLLGYPVGRTLGSDWYITDFSGGRVSGSHVSTTTM